MTTSSEHLGLVRIGRMNALMRRSLTFLSFLVLSLYVGFISIRWDAYDNWFKARFGDMVYGTAWRPFVYRSFVPFLIRSARALLPGSVDSSIGSFLNHHPSLIFVEPNVQFKIERLLYLTIDIFALVLFAYGIRRLMRSAGLSNRWSFVSALVVLASLPAYFNYSNHIYDTATLALFTWSLVFIAEQKWTLYLLTFALCVWNKETAVLLGWIFLLTHWRLLRAGDKKFWALLLSQAVIASIILVWIRVTFSSNYGGGVELHYMDRDRPFFLGYTIQSYITVLMLLFLLSYRFKEQHSLLRNGITILPLLLVLTFFFGLLDEYRDYYEALPIVATMISVSLYKIGRQTGLIQTATPERQVLHRRDTISRRVDRS
jgi:hypothetical protein